MRTATRAARRETRRLDLTPAIDVTFLLLIFFLCLEFKTLDGKLDANLPHELGPRPSRMPVDKIDLRIVNTAWGREVRAPGAGRFELEGHACQWYLGPQRIRSGARLERALRQAARVLVLDRHGAAKRRPLTIQTGPGVAYQDVTAVVDLALDAGFEEITFARGQGTRASRRVR